MHFKLPKVAIGPLNLANLDVSWTGSSDQWKGTAELNLFAAGVKVSVQFDKGQVHRRRRSRSPLSRTPASSWRPTRT